MCGGCSEIEIYKILSIYLLFIIILIECLSEDFDVPKDFEENDDEYHLQMYFIFISYFL